VRVREKFARYERRARVLERLAAQYPKSSPEVAALREAGYALCFAFTEKYDEFAQYVARMNKPMTKSEEKHLKRLGLS